SGDLPAVANRRFACIIASDAASATSSVVRRPAGRPCSPRSRPMTIPAKIVHTSRSAISVQVGCSGIQLLSVAYVLYGTRVRDPGRLRVLCLSHVDAVSARYSPRIAVTVDNIGNLASATGLASLIDHTLLKPEASKDQVARVCREARQHSFASVCINPYWV